MDTLDRAAEVEALFQEERLAAHRRPSIRLVPVTLMRECEDCGTRIPDARLAAVPNAVCCVDCQQLWEVCGVG